MQESVNGHSEHSGALAASLLEMPELTPAHYAEQKRVDDLEQQLEVAKAHLNDVLNRRVEPQGPPQFVFRTLTDALDLPPQDWLVPGLIAEGSKVLLSAAPKTGKSYLLLGLLRAAAEGGNFLGLTIPHMNAWYFSEMSQRVVSNQLETLKFGRTDKIQALYKEEQPTLASNQEFADTLYNAFMNTPEPPKLIVFDTLAAFVQMADLNDYAGVQRDLAPILHCADLLASVNGCAMLFAHHDRKAMGNGSDAVLGSRVLAGLMDTLLYLKLRPSTTHRRLTIQSRLGIGQLGEQADVVLHVPTGEFQVVAQGADRAAAVIEALHTGITKRSQIAAYLGEVEGIEISAFNLSKALKELEDSGAIVSTGSTKSREYKLAGRED